jgi:dihydroflavonol-4-reductase
MARTPMYFSSAKAGRELNYAARPWQAAVHDALAWFGAHGYLK